jgi:hypothetical protein
MTHPEHRAPAAMPSRGQGNPRRGISVSSRWGRGPSATEKKFVGILALVALCHAPTYAQSGEINLKATSANVSEPGSPVRVQILRWSTDMERTPVVAALNPAPPPPATPARAAGDGRGAAAAGRGRGGAARGGRGEAAAPLTPVAALTAAIGKGPTVGYIWTNDVTGYSIKYAYHAPLPDGGERIILATDRRLGAHTAGWKLVTGAGTPAEAPLTDYEFTLIEIRLDPKGLGEGKTSLTTKVVVDDSVPGAKTVALDNYAAAPAIFKNVKR